MTDTYVPTGAVETAGALAAVVDAWLEAWNEADRDRRRELVDRSLVSEGRYADPFLEAVGADAIADAMGGLREQFPGHSVRRRSGIEEHFGRIRYAWELLAPEGAIVTDGVDFAELAPDGRFSHLVGFVGQVVAVPLS